MSEPRSDAWRGHALAADRMVLLWVALGVLGFVARLTLACFSSGTNDILSFEDFGEQIARYGLLQEYRHNVLFNHPPLVGWFARAAVWLSRLLDVRFSLVFKLPMIAADGVSALLIAWVWRRRQGARSGARGFALFALSPIAILISAHHGNTDSLCAMWVLLSAVLTEACGLSWAAGLALGAAINVKLIPVFCIPPLLCAQPRALRAWLMFGFGLSLGALPFVPVLLQVGAEFHRNAIAYNSNPDYWGVMHLLRVWGEQPGQHAAAVRAMRGYRALGRSLVPASIALVSVWSGSRRRLDTYALVALSLGLFLVLAPGFGVQYLVYPAPLLVLVHPWFGFAYGCVAGLFAAVLYACFWEGELPFHSQFFGPFPAPSHPFSLATWVLLLVFVCAMLRRGWTPRGRSGSQR